MFVSASDTGTDRLLADTDGDGFDDGVEVAFGSNPNSASSFPGSVDVPALDAHWQLALVLVMLGISVTWLSRRYTSGANRA